jgi:hypothetical protein
MTINRNNFEAYLLDYLEGNLEPLLTADLMAFLAENPEFEKYIPDFETQVLPAGQLQFGYKEMLKKDFADIPSVTLQNFDEFCIASCEGILSQKDISRLHDYIAHHPEKQKDLDLYRASKLQPDLSISFSGNAKLKKTEPRTFPLRYLYLGLGIAASVALVFLLILNRNPEAGKVIPSMANQENKVINQDLPVAGKETVPAESNPSDRQQADRTEVKGTAAETTDQPEIADAAADTVREGFILAALDPIDPTLPAVDYPSLEIPPPATENAEHLQRAQHPAWSSSESFLGSLLARIDFWKTAEKAISGFNYLTESQLSISKTTDEEGNLTGLLLNTESYTITGKTK